MLYILTPIFCVALLCGTVFSFSKTDNKVTASADVIIKASGAYLDLSGGMNSKILNGFEGAQKEYVYFGTNGGNTVKWRVLSKSGSDYGSGMLLWADKQIANEVYNPDGNNPEYAFWGTSKLRASLNGGDYYSNTSVPAETATISEASSWYGKLFTEDEKRAVKATGNYRTDNWGLDTTQSQYFYLKEGIIDSTDKNGKYNFDRISDKTDHPTAQHVNYDISKGTVWEMTSGDKLFLLDYYDINNLDYGFGDNGQIYANNVSSSWKPSSNWYPGYYDGGKTFNNKTSDYLKFSGDLSGYCWLRPAGRDNASGSAALRVLSSGSIDNSYGVANPSGVRPAFNLDTSKIAYVNRNSGTVSSTFTNVSGTTTAKPEYKLYVKSADYNSFSSNAINAMTVEGNNLKIAYNNPASVESGNIIVLLTEKDSTDGAVKYQAAVALSSTADASKTAVATFSLAGIDYSQYDTTVLLTSANGGIKTETVYCSYNMEGNVTVPSDVENLTYDGTCKWVGSLSTKPDWYDENLHNNENVMTVSEISYKSMAKDATFTPLTAEAGKKLTDLIVDAGEYEITMTLDNGLKWAGSNTTGGDKKFKIKIGQKPSSVTPVYAAAPTYLPDTLPAISLSADSTKGNIAWDDEQKIEVGNKSYTWTFTPTDTNNYTVVTDSKSFNFAAREVEKVTIKSFNPVDDEGQTVTVYTNTTSTTLMSYMTVEVKYKQITKTETIDAGTYELLINDDNVLVAGNNVLKVRYNKIWSAEFSISGVEELSYASIEMLTLKSGVKFTYPVQASDIIAAIDEVDTKRNDGQSHELTAEEIASLMLVEGDLSAGTKKLTFKIKDTDVEFEKNITIAQGEYDMKGVSFTGGDPITYDGQTHSIAITGTLPEGVTVKYYKSDGTTEFTGAVNVADSGKVIAKFTGDSKNYKAIDDKEATLTIKQATVTGITFADEVQPEITGTTYTLEATGVPAWVTVKYYYNGAEFTGASAAGEYEITAKFTHSDPNYEQIDDITKTLTISDKPEVEGAKDIVVEPTISATYTGSPVDYSAKNVPDGVDVSYTIVKEDDAAFSGKEIVGVGVYTVTVSFDTGTAYAPIADKTCVVTVGKATVDMSGVDFADKTVTGNGQPHKVEATNLPQGVTVEYEYKGKKQTTPFEFTEVDDYTVKAYFTYEDEDNYEAIKPIEVTLTISDAVVTKIEAKRDESVVYTTANGLDDLKEKLTVTAVYDNGTTEVVTDYELSCNNLRDNGKFKAGPVSVTVKYTSEGEEFTAVVNLTAEREKVALPTFKGGLNYTGVSLKPTVENFNGYDSELMTFVVDKTVPGLTVGSYKAVFALNDSENYEWTTATTLKKTVFAVALYDEEITLNANEAAVDWNISKAVLTATKADGALPIFASESYIGAFADVVTLKYYKDEACTEEIAAADLAHETTYFVKAELLDTENFELDTSAAQYTVKSFTYTTPAKELTTWDKIVRFLKTNWLWLVIAVVALILLILIIALAARSAKKKRERAELAEQRRFEKEEREREERKLEREERMARLSQQQQMPQMMMPQMMPQMMGQMPQMQAPQSQTAAQPAAGGGMVTEAQFMQVQAELAALKAAQENAKEVAELRAEAIRSEAALRAEAALRNDINALRAGGGQDITGGMTAATLVEIVTEAMEKVLDSREKGTAQSATATPEAAPAATQVPPDAVMTTVTTTKIDTTKKSAQTAQTQAQATRPIVRSYVAPMPVDDGRVFDVGGFYTPADPVDLNFEEDEKKD